MWGRAGGVADWSRRAFTQRSNDAVEVRGSFQETAPRKTDENTVKHRDGGVGSAVANHRGGGESSVVVTTQITIPQTLWNSRHFLTLRGTPTHVVVTHVKQIILSMLLLSMLPVSYKFMGVHIIQKCLRWFNQSKMIKTCNTSPQQSDVTQM